MFDWVLNTPLEYAKQINSDFLYILHCKDGKDNSKIRKKVNPLMHNIQNGQTLCIKGSRKKVLSFSGLVGYSSRNKFKIESFKI